MKQLFLFVALSFSTYALGQYPSVRIELTFEVAIVLSEFGQTGQDAGDAPKF